MLRPLLRTEVGEVSNRRAWCDDTLLTPDLLELYKRPLQVENWDAALIEVRRQRGLVGLIGVLGAVVPAGTPSLARVCGAAASDAVGQLPH